MSDEAQAAIQLAHFVIGDRERELVDEVLSSDVLALGPFAATVRGGSRSARRPTVRRGLQQRHGRRCTWLSVPWASATGDEVITTPFSFVASANCILYERATSRCSSTSMRTRWASTRSASRRRSHQRTAGDPAGPRLRPPGRDRRARARSPSGTAWHLIEDACEALGCDASAGAAWVRSGRPAVFAFYPNKQITTGEGGCVVTDDEELAAVFRSLRNQGRDDDGTWLRHVRLGYNYRMDELSAAIGVAQLERLEELRAGRARAAAAYERGIGRSRVDPPAARGPGRPGRLVRLRGAPRCGHRSRRGDGGSGRAPACPAARTSARSTCSRYTERPRYRGRRLPGHRAGGGLDLALPWGPRLDEDTVGRVAESLIAAVERPR